ncbi:hypothetical protein LTR84_012412 [Exophiala bonariae]|uniref:Nitroreductase domain-containing protein n=1 Tax=Exophiala bonariae TaxID=1690606 RepID=A0AAV9MUD5_9EURO|nr:hypothetical protein LTR84_012412 [Exophiala bonariae]
MSKVVTSSAFLDAVRSRRSFYQLNNRSPIDSNRLAEIIKTTVLHCPSSFNSQSTRLLVLLNEEHKKLWDITKHELEPLVHGEQRETTMKKLDGLRAGYGTILFYEDPKPTAELQSKFPLYATKFPQWAEHSNAMHQYIRFGCNLQHYNPVIDLKVGTKWKVNPNWSLKGQLVFGSPIGDPKEKSYQPWESRVDIRGL